MKKIIQWSGVILGAMTLVSRLAVANVMQEQRLNPIRVLTASGKAMVDIGLIDYRSNSASCRRSQLRANASTVVALHGLAHTAATWKPLAQALFGADEASGSQVQSYAIPQFMGNHVCRVIAFDMPGRGELAKPGIPLDAFPSGFIPAPESMPVSLDGSPSLFRNLMLDDYAAIAVQVMEALSERRELGSKTMLLGHSLGALVWELAEEQMQQEDRSLKDFGVTKAVFLASSIPAPLPWAFANVNSHMLLNPFRAVTPEFGFFYALPDSLFPTFFMSDRSLFQSTIQYLTTGQGVPSGLQAESPSVADIRAQALNAIEPELIVYQLLRGQIQRGDAFIPPPTIRKGLMRGAFEVALVTFSEDSFVQKSEVLALGGYLVNVDRSSPEIVIASDSDYKATRVQFSTFPRLVNPIIPGPITKSVEATGSARFASVGRGGASVTEISGPLAVHDFHLTEPVLLVNLLKK